MDFKSKIKELRTLVPVPISEAFTLLKANNRDVYKSAEQFKEKSIDYIILQTGCDKEIATAKYILEKYDINKAISSIREDEYDKNYKPIEDVTRAKLLKIREWFNIEKTEGFATSLQYTHIDSVIDTLSLIPSLKDIAIIIQKALDVRNTIFEGYSDNDPMTEFIRRNVKLDNDPEYNKYWETFKSKTILLNEELTRHIRNSQ